MADWTCATHALTTQHGSCTNSCGLLLDRDFNNQSLVFGSVDVGRLENISTLSSKQWHQPKQLQTCQTSTRQVKEEKRGGGGGGSLEGRCKSGCMLGTADFSVVCVCPNSNVFTCFPLNISPYLAGAGRTIFHRRFLGGQNRGEHLGFTSPIGFGVARPKYLQRVLDVELTETHHPAIFFDTTGKT